MNLENNPFYNQSQISHIWLTRECNLSCEYCSVVRDTPYYEPVSGYKEKELSAREWFEHIVTLNKLGSKFFLLYGAEPVLFSELGELIDLLNNTDIHYSLHTNGTLQKQLDELIKDHPLKGLTFSWDPAAMDDNVLGKSNVATKLFTKYKEVVDDLVVTITLLPNIENKDNAEKLLAGIEWFNENGIYSIVTVIDHARNQYYDFSNVAWADDEKIKVTPKLLELIDSLKAMQTNGMLFHNYPEYWDELPAWLEKENYKCEKVYAFNVVDADGSLRLCNRIKGDVITKFTPSDMISSPDIVLRAFDTDFNLMCDGCSWDCAQHANAHNRIDTYDKDKLDKQFTH